MLRRRGAQSSCVLAHRANRKEVQLWVSKAPPVSAAVLASIASNSNSNSASASATASNSNSTESSESAAAAAIPTTPQPEAESNEEAAFEAQLLKSADEIRTILRLPATAHVEYSSHQVCRSSARALLIRVSLMSR